MWRLKYHKWHLALPPNVPEGLFFIFFRKRIDMEMRRIGVLFAQVLHGL